MGILNNKTYIGVSVTPETGLEVAEIDFATGTVLKYGRRDIEYNSAQRNIADMDIFKTSLQDLFLELQIPKGSQISVSVSTPIFGVNDYAAALDDAQLDGVIEDFLSARPEFQNEEPAFSKKVLPNSTLQLKKVAFTAINKSFIYELCIIIKELGCKIYSIDSSVNSLVNSLRYLNRVNTEAETSWILLVVDQYMCRVIFMIGENYSDVFEEKISIASILGDDENYEIVSSTVNPILNNLPAKYLCIVSQTDIISAEKLAKEISYSAPITYQEANVYSKEAFLPCDSSIPEELALSVSLNIIGTAIYKNFLPYASAKLNLYNRSLGEIYLSEQPPEMTINGKTVVLSPEFLIKAFAVAFVFIFIPAILAWRFLGFYVDREQEQVDDLSTRIQEINRFLKDNENISAELFDEGDGIQSGLNHNRLIYYLYTVVGTEIPKKLWLTSISLDDKFTIEGQADNIESIYSFFRSIKNYVPDSGVKLQKLGLATVENSKSSFDTDSLLNSLNADFYDFRISNREEVSIPQVTGNQGNENNKNNI